MAWCLEHKKGLVSGEGKGNGEEGKTFSSSLSSLSVVLRIKLT